MTSLAGAWTVDGPACCRWAALVQHGLVGQADADLPHPAKGVTAAQRASRRTSATAFAPLRATGASDSAGPDG